jgi:hypothetical protein
MTLISQAWLGPSPPPPTLLIPLLIYSIFGNDKYDPSCLAGANSLKQCCYITVDFANAAASQKGVCITQQKCHK